MKLPFDLGVKLFFRLILPGFFITLGLWPPLYLLLVAAGLAGQGEAAFVVTLIVAGWLIVAADMRIYMLLEGRRFWPQWMARRMRGLEQRRVKRLERRVDAFYASGGGSDPDVRRRYLEASFDLRSLPIDANGDWYAEFPTRLGNTIHAFESYSKSRYGLEAIFYWPRIWVHLEKDLREELDGQQAMSDSCVYSAFTLGVAGLLWALYGLIVLLEVPLTRLIGGEGGLPTAVMALIALLPSAGVCAALAVTGLLLAWLASRLAISTNEQFGVVFMAIIDSHAEKVRSEYVPVDAIVKRVAALTGSRLEPADELEVARRYLQYHTVRVPGRERAVPVAKLEVEAKARGARVGRWRVFG